MHRPHAHLREHPAEDEVIGCSGVLERKERVNVV